MAKAVFPEKPADARKCLFCWRHRRNGPLIGEGTLCKQHDDTTHVDMAYLYFVKPTIPQKEKPRRRIVI